MASQHGSFTHIWSPKRNKKALCDTRWEIYIKWYFSWLKENGMYFNSCWQVFGTIEVWGTKTCISVKPSSFEDFFFINQSWLFVLKHYQKIFDLMILNRTEGGKRRERDMGKEKESEMGGVGWGIRRWPHWAVSKPSLTHVLKPALSSFYVSFTYYKQWLPSMSVSLCLALMALCLLFISNVTVSAF